MFVLFFSLLNLNLSTLYKREIIRMILNGTVLPDEMFYVFSQQLLQELCLTYRLDIPGHVRSSQLGILEGRYKKSASETELNNCYCGLF